MSTNNYDPKAALEDLTKRGKLKELTVNGVTSSIFDYNDRKFVVVPIHDVDVPFYLSSGQAGKKNVPAGKWYPVFGIGPDGWINKGTQADIVNHYGYDTFKKVAEKLDEKLGDIRGWQTAEIGFSTEDEFFSAINKGLGEPGIPHSNSGNELPGKIGRIFQKMTENAALKKQQILQSAAPVVPPVTSVPAATIAPINPIAATATPAPAPVSAPAPTQTQVPVNSTRPLKDRILSFDIETSNLDPGTGHIWQTGYAKYNGDQIETSSAFFDTKERMPIDEIEKQLTTSEFGKKQHAAGRFTEYLGATKEPQKDVMKNLLSAMSGDSDILLIQNSNFERRWLEDAIYADPSIDNLNNTMSHSYTKRGTSREIGSLHAPPKVLEYRNAASAKFYEFLKTGDAGLFKESAQMHENVMNEYFKAFEDTTSGKYKVVDMMDITKAVFSKAAEKGLMDKRYAQIGTSQSFLANMFGLGEETHLAPDDSKQALRIFVDYLMPMYKELQSGNISQSTVDTFKKISEAQPREALSQQTRSIVRALDEAESQGGYRQTTSDVMKAESLEFKNNITGEMDTAERSFNTGRRVLRSADAALVVADVNSRYAGIPMPGFTPEQLTAHVASIPSAGDQEKFVRGLAEEVANTNNAIPTIDTASNNGAGLKSWFKSNRNKSIALGLAALGAIAIADSDNGSAEEIKTTKAAKRQMSQSIDNSLRIYSKPRISIDPDHGSGFADWNERTRHNEYF